MSDGHPPVGEPVLAARGQSPAAASRPDPPGDEGRWHVYESNPAPWWVAVMWAAFFLFGVAYLIRNLIE
jgi:hypothetical protein